MTNIWEIKSMGDQQGVLYTYGVRIEYAMVTED